jgi:hypothetical protein
LLPRGGTNVIASFYRRIMETPLISSQKTVPEQRQGLVPGMAHLALEVVERTQLTTLALAQDVRGEIRITAESALDLAEKALGAVIRISRKLVQRIDDAAAQTISSAERLVGSGMRSARDTTHAATDLATTALQGVAGPRSASA